ncbi:hypothetical protein PSI22_14655 [Xenorhabdus sp. XENO-7]|uniref:Uncharacterized protein n=1 Tax=Xenorhabdus aichiensis TaxID=3025874 RepID=A0ABT5M579_9GAMM|nr:hypothetical protein [Xenorhabdus aichiensis]MDC9622846.1 hypothetical protein [Xenorhabdus aichiensis]
MPLAKSNGQGFASLSIQTRVGCFCQCVCYRPFNGGSGRGGLGLAGWTLPVLRTLSESPPSMIN